MRRNGLEVRDATAPLTVKVTQKDIDQAVQRDPETCAVARGCKRMKDVIDVRIGATTAFVDRGNYIERFVIDPDDRKRLAVFDRDGYFAPGTYRLLPPPEERKIGARAGQKSGSNTRNRKAAQLPLRPRVSAGMFL